MAFFNFVLLFFCSFVLLSANGEPSSKGETFIVSSFSYPHTRLRPFDLRYIRVDLPSWFSSMSIAMNSDVDLDVSRIERVPMSTLPIICFRDGGPPLPDALNLTLKDSAISGINGLDVEQCFPMQKNITMKLTNNQISPGVWFIGLFNGIGPTRTQSKMIVRGPAYSFAANITVEACTNSMMMGDFCNSPVYPFSCTTTIPTTRNSTARIHLHPYYGMLFRLLNFPSFIQFKKPFSTTKTITIHFTKFAFSFSAVAISNFSGTHFTKPSKISYFHPNTFLFHSKTRRTILLPLTSHAKPTPPLSASPATIPSTPPAPAAIPPSGSRNLRTASWQTTLQIAISTTYCPPP